MKVELTLEKSKRGRKYYLILDDNFITRISKKQYQLLSIYGKWWEQYSKWKEQDGKSSDNQ